MSDRRQIEAARRGRNRALGILLLGLAGLVFAVTLVKLGAVGAP